VGITLSPHASSNLNPERNRPGDVDLYQAVVDRTHAGEGYYDDDWSELNAKIDALGKGQIFQGYYKFETKDILKKWETFTSRKLFFHVTPEQCEEVISQF
jgi:hypothetical protein